MHARRIAAFSRPVQLVCLTASLGALLFIATLSARASTFTNLQVVWPFAATNGTGFPFAAVTEGSDGMLYGTTFGGVSASDLGSVFKMDKAGHSLSLLHQFTLNEGDGSAGKLIEGTNGVLYGTTSQDATNGGGTAFQINKDGSGFKVIHFFTMATNDGGSPFGGLLQASDGELYGTTQFGGIASGGGDGVVFKMDLSGSNFTVLHSFSNVDGSAPECALIEGTNGALYGTTYSGGTSNSGTLFRIDKDGNNFSVFHNFAGGTNDGAHAYASLCEGPNGRLYGATVSGGLHDAGIVFSLDHSGNSYTVLYNFGDAANDGASPYNNLVQGPDGLLYGTTYFGGNSTGGTVYGLNPDGSGYTVLVRFAGNSNGANPNPLILASDGAFYGTCNESGPLGDGTLFKLTGVLLPVLARPIRIVGAWQINGHGTANANYTLLASTNFSAPKSNWTVLGPVATDSSGNFQFNDPAILPQRFYQTSIP